MDFVVNWVANTPVFATPLLLATLGLIVTERSGVMSLGAEGFMLCGALASVGAYLTFGGSTAISIVAAMLAAAAVSLIFALLVVLLRIDQVISGLAIVFFCQGLTGLVGTSFDWDNKGIEGLVKIDFGALSHLPVLGKILFSQDLLVYLAIPMVIAVHWLLTSSYVGMRLRAVGENPEAADAAGINVTLYRFGAVLAGAALMGLAGGYLALASAKIWVPGMTGGRGWIAVALVIFSRWHPWRALGGAILFGCIESVIPRIDALGVAIPQYFMLMTPYVATLIVMVYAALSKRQFGSAPAALGVPYIREERR